MRVLILAAGRGTRISRYLSGNPKCTVDIGGKKLIHYTIDLLKSRGIDDIGIVVGYRQDVMTNVLQNQNVKIFYNPFYDITNSIVSAWFAKDFFADEEMLIMNGDVFMEEELLDIILRSSKSPVLFSDETRKDEADYKFYYKDDVLLKYGKELSGKDITAEYVGIAKLDRAFIPQFKRVLEEMVFTQQHSVWWENVLYSMVGKQNIYVQDVEGKFWAEVDYVEDYERIKEYVSSRKYDFN